MSRSRTTRLTIVNALVIATLLLFTLLAPWRGAYAEEAPGDAGTTAQPADTDGSGSGDSDAGAAGDSGGSGESSAGSGESSSGGAGDPAPEDAGSDPGGEPTSPDPAGSGDGSAQDADNAGADNGGSDASGGGGDDAASEPEGSGDGSGAGGDAATPADGGSDETGGGDAAPEDGDLAGNEETSPADSNGSGDGAPPGDLEGAGGGSEPAGQASEQDNATPDDNAGADASAGSPEAGDDGSAGGGDTTSLDGGGTEEAADPNEGSPEGDAVTSTIQIRNDDVSDTEITSPESNTGVSDAASTAPENDTELIGDTEVVPVSSAEVTQEEVDQVEAVLDAVTDAQQAVDLIEPAPAAAAGGDPTTDASELTDAIAEVILNDEGSGEPATSTEGGSETTTDPVAQAVGELVANVMETSSEPAGTDPVVQQVFIPATSSSVIEEGVSQLLVTGTDPVTMQTTTAEVTVVTTESGTIVQIIDTSLFSPSSPDPSGIAYLPGSDRLLISDAEVEEMAIFQGVNLYELTRTGSLTDTGVTTAYSREPTGLGFNAADGTLFVADDQADRIFLVQPGTDGRHGTADDERIGEINVRNFGVPVDPEGVEYDPATGHVFIADGDGREVWRVDPGANGVFGDTDDAVSHFDVEQFGIRDPEGLGMVAARDNLMIVDNPTNAVYEITKTGELVRKVDLSALKIVTPRRLAGVVLAPGTDDPNRLNLWIAARGVDNNADPNENDGKIFEVSWPSAPFLVEPPPPPPTQTLDIPVAAGSDDAEEKPTGAVVTGQAGLELVDISAGHQTVGLRFVGVTLNSGATVVNAYVQFTALKTPRHVTNLTIQGQAADNAETFRGTAFNISSRARTSASAQWTPPRWTIIGEAGVSQRTPDLSGVIQEIIDRSGWVSGNALALVVTGSGKRVASAFEGGAAPILHIEYTDSGTAVVTALSSSLAGPGQTSDDLTRVPQTSSETASSAPKDECVRCARRAALQERREVRARARARERRRSCDRQGAVAGRGSESGRRLTDRPGRRRAGRRHCRG